MWPLSPFTIAGFIMTAIGGGYLGVYFALLTANHLGTISAALLGGDSVSSLRAVIETISAAERKCRRPLIILRQVV
jgi:hypothetical protein